MTVRRIVAAAIGIAVLAGAGCSSEPESGDAAPPVSEGSKTTTSAPASTPAKSTPAPKPAPRPLSVPMYQRALTNVEKVLRTYVVRVMNAQTLQAIDASRAQLAAAVVLERKASDQAFGPG